MNLFKLAPDFHLGDYLVIGLRSAGFSPWLDSEGLHTNATRAQVHLVNGNPWWEARP